MQKPEMEWNRDTAHVVSMERCGPYFILGEALHMALVRNAEGQAVEAGKKAGELLRALGASGRPVAAKLDGKAIDLESVVVCEGVLEPIFADSEEGLDIIRHSTAHLMAQAVQGDGYDSRVMATELAPGTDFTSAALVKTGNKLDVGIRGDGWLAVQTSDGEEAYTRAGDLAVSSTGALTLHGQPVLGDAGELVLPDLIEPAADATDEESGEEAAEELLPTNGVTLQ